MVLVECTSLSEHPLKGLIGCRCHIIDAGQVRDADTEMIGQALYQRD